jgi:hypothetical protein
MTAGKEASMHDHARDDHQERYLSGGLDAEEFARRLLGFAIDAYRALKDPASTPDDLIGLHSRA